MVGELVKAQTSDGYLLNGFFVPGTKGKPVILHVHGYGGNFYANQFVHTIGDMLSANGCSFLTIETRGSYDQQGLAVYGKGFDQTGAYMERLADAYRDIDAWIDFLLKKGFDQIVLEGHSLGTVKSVRYMHEGLYSKLVMKLVLLCPFDRFSLAEKSTCGYLSHYVDEARINIEQKHNHDLVPIAWGGLPMSYGTFVSWYEDTDANHAFDYTKPDFQSQYLQKIQPPVTIIVGSKDEFFSPLDQNQSQTYLDRLSSQFFRAQNCLVNDARHSFKGYEDIVAEKIKEFITFA